MVTDAVDPIKELDKALELIKKRREKLSKRNPEANEGEAEKEVKKAEKPKKKKSLKVYSRVAVVALCFVCFYGLVSMLYFPNVYEIIASIIESLFNNGFSDSPGLDHFVN